MPNYQDINLIYAETDISYSQFIIDTVEEVYLDIKDWNRDALLSRIYYLNNVLEIMVPGKDKQLLIRLISALEPQKN